MPGALPGQETGSLDPQEVRQLIEQNRQLQAQIKAQQQTIEELKSKMTAIDQANVRNQDDLQSLRDRIDGGAGPEAKPASIGQAIRISGEIGFAFFASGHDGPFANNEFRVDDAKIFLEAPIWKNVFLHSELQLQTREAPDNNFHLGEIYADFENISGQWGEDRLLNVRVGRMYSPFGEEYQNRGIMANPLVSHSVSDIWDIDEGIEIYGQAANASYFLAVQDGGINALRNFHTDKSVALRIACDPSDWLHLSASAMRTGHLGVSDSLSALWFGNGFFRALGPAGTTSGFWADLVEMDGAVKWAGGHVKAAGGLVRFDDNNRAGGDARHMAYYYTEAMQTIADRLYGAVRFSGLRVPGGYPVAGQGTMGEYFFGNVLTMALYRLSMGFGYQFGPPLVLKMDFSPEWGRTSTGENRSEENLFSAELGMKF